MISTLLHKVKSETIVECDPKALFSIANTFRCGGGGATPFPGFIHFTLDHFLIMLSVKQCGVKYHFWVFGMTRPGIELHSPGSLVNTLLLRQNCLSRYLYGIPIKYRLFSLSYMISIVLIKYKYFFCNNMKSSFLIQGKKFTHINMVSFVHIKNK